MVRRTEAGVALASLLTFVCPVRAQLIPLESSYQAKYSGLRVDARQKADRLFSLSISDPGSTFRTALDRARTISSTFKFDVPAYRNTFNSAWYNSHILPTYQTSVTPAPSEPERLAKTDPWGYPNFLKREVSAILASSSGSRAFKELSTNLSLIFPSSKFAKVGERAFGYFFKPSSAPLLLDRSEVVSSYQLAIDAASLAQKDSVLASTIDDLLINPNQNKISVLEIALGAPNLDKAKNEPRYIWEAALKERQRQAIERIKQSIEEKKHSTTDKKISEDQDSRETRDREFEFDLGEFEGISRVLIGILQLSDKDAARGLARYSDAIVKFGKLYDSYFIDQTIGPMAFTGGWFTLVLAVMNSEAESDERAAIFDALKSIAEELKDLRRLFLTGFEQIDTKLDLVIGLQLSSIQMTQAQLAQLKSLSTQSLENISQLSAQISDGNMSAAERDYQRFLDDSETGVTSACTLVGPSEARYRDCVRTLARTALFTSRGAFAKALSVADTPPRGLFSLSDPVTHSDAIVAKLLSETQHAPQSEYVSIEGDRELLPAGFPSPYIWLESVKRMRQRLEIPSRPMSPLDRDVLQALKSDGAFLQQALSELEGSAATKAWEAYIDSLATLSRTIRKIISDQGTYQTQSGLLFNLWDFCFDCEFRPDGEVISSSSNPTIEWVNEHPEWLSARTNPKWRLPWSKRREVFDWLDGIFLNKLTATPKEQDGRWVFLGDKSLLVDYWSLPKKFRDQLHLEQEEKLSEFGAIRLYAKLHNLEWRQPGLSETNSARDGDYRDCGPVQPAQPPGKKCFPSGPITGTLEIVAVRGPITESVGQISQAIPIRFRGTTHPVLIAQALEIFGPKPESPPPPVSEKVYHLYSYNLNIGTLIPIAPGGNFSKRLWPARLQEVLSYIYHDLDQENRTVKSLPDVQVLTTAIQEALKRKQDVLLDLYRAVKSGATPSEVLPARLAIADDEANSVYNAAVKAETLFKKWVVLNAMASENADWPVLAAKCSIRADNLVGLLSHREWFYRDEERLLIVGDPVVRTCFDSSFVAPKRLGISVQVDDWQNWISGRLAAKAEDAPPRRSAPDRKR